MALKIENNETNTDNSDKQAITTGNFKGDKIVYAGITHYKYFDCQMSDIVIVDGMKIHKDCAAAFKKMRDDAKKDRINLKIVSGFRSTEYQKTIFPKKFADKKNPSEKEFVSRLKFSAPSGFSEHHTGFAIDINSLEEDFADTKEYKWLFEHAKDYGFEMSFPENNRQGLGFEPWHWRYVGTAKAKNIFRQAR